MSEPKISPQQISVLESILASGKSKNPHALKMKITMLKIKLSHQRSYETYLEYLNK
jgi:hypothetical protein